MKRFLLLLVFLLASFSLSAQTAMVKASLPGRNLNPIKITIPEYDFSESGNVVVEIEVNRDGKIVKANAGAEGTTLKNEFLLTKCRESAMEVTFEKNHSTEYNQLGKIEYIYISNNITVEHTQQIYTNPLSGCELSDSFSLIENPIEYPGARIFRVFQVIDKDKALALSEDTYENSLNNFGPPIVMILYNQPNMLYDDLIINIPSNQKLLQLGIYRYTNKEEIIKTVPIISIVDK